MKKATDSTSEKVDIFIETTSDIEPLTKITAHGVLDSRGGLNRINYVEPVGDLQGTETNMILKEDHVTIMRKGINNAKLDFMRGRRMDTYYETPYGALVVTTETSEVNLTKTSDGLECFVKYALQFGGTGDTDKRSIKIKVRKEAK